MEDRTDYTKGRIQESEFLADPIKQLEKWLIDAKNARVNEPLAMCLSTVDQNGQPSSRMVLLRGLDQTGLRFFTNHQSRKGQDMLQNSHVALCFWWAELERQLRIEGTAKRTSDEESDVYFASRPYASQAAAIVSPQSAVIESRKKLEDDFNQLVESAKPLKCPANWGGYVVSPKRIEFWQGRPARLHDRIVYQRVESQWVRHRLAP